MSKHRWIRATLGVLLVTLWGCGSSQGVSQKDLASLQAQVDRMRREQGEMSQRVTHLEVAARRPQRGIVHRQANHHDGRPPLNVVVLRPDNAYDEEPFEAADAGPRDTIMAAGRHSEGKIRPAAASGNGKQARRAKADRRYSRARSLYRDHKYRRALEALTGFLVRYPGHPKAASAMFLMGESYRRKENPRRAVEAYEGMLARFPKSDLVPDALWGLAQAQLDQGQKTKARRNVERLRAKFPNSDAAKKARRHKKFKKRG